MTHILYIFGGLNFVTFVASIPIWFLHFISTIVLQLIWLLNKRKYANSDMEMFSQDYNSII